MWALRTNSLERQLHLGLALSLLLLLLLQRWVVRRSFHQLEPLRVEIQKLAERGGQRLNEEVPAEIRPLVEEFNHLLELLSQRNERSRNALVVVVGLIHQERTVSVELQFSPSQACFGDQEDIFELIGNLLDNAYNWASERVRVILKLR
jgi:signal transduction histidine kinase